MISLIVNLLSGLVEFLGNVLPDSPFRDVSFFQGVDVFLGWFNWVCPVGAMLASLAAWIALCVAWAAIDFIKGLVSDGIIGRLTK